MYRGLKGIQEPPGRLVIELEPDLLRSIAKRSSKRKPSRSKPPAHKVFLCYRRSDKIFVSRVRDRLIREDVPVWMDNSHLALGDKWQVVIQNALSQSWVVVVFVGPDGLGDFQGTEVATALNLEAQGLLKVIPAILPGVEDADIPPFLRTFHYADFRRRNRPFKQLVEGILRLLGNDGD